MASDERKVCHEHAEPDRDPHDARTVRGITGELKGDRGYRDDDGGHCAGNPKWADEWTRDVAVPTAQQNEAHGLGDITEHRAEDCHVEQREPNDGPARFGP